MGEAILLLDGKPLLRTLSGLPELEYALFDAGEVTLRASDIGAIREVSYQTRVAFARDRLERAGIFSGLGDTCANTIRATAVLGYARGPAAQRVLHLLTPAELFDGFAFDPEKKSYEGFFLDLHSLARDLSHPTAAMILQAIALFERLKDAYDSDELSLDTESVMADTRPGERSYRRVSLPNVERLFTSLQELAEKSVQATLRSPERSPKEILEFMEARTNDDVRLEDIRRMLAPPAENRVRSSPMISVGPKPSTIPPPNVAPHSSRGPTRPGIDAPRSSFVPGNHSVPGNQAPAHQGRLSQPPPNQGVAPSPRPDAVTVAVPVPEVRNPWTRTQRILSPPPGVAAGPAPKPISDRPLIGTATYGSPVTVRDRYAPTASAYHQDAIRTPPARAAVQAPSAPPKAVSSPPRGNSYPTQDGPAVREPSSPPSDRAAPMSLTPAAQSYAPPRTKSSHPPGSVASPEPANGPPSSSTDQPPAFFAGPPPREARAGLIGASLPPMASEDERHIRVSANLTLPKRIPSRSLRAAPEIVENLSLPPGLHGEISDEGSALPTNVLDARIKFTHWARELGRQYKNEFGTILKTDLHSIELIQARLRERFPEGMLKNATEQHFVEKHGALLAEILIRTLGAEWTDIAPTELGYWEMTTPPSTRVWPFGRVFRYITMGSKERDLVSFFLEVQLRAHSQRS